MKYSIFLVLSLSILLLLPSVFALSTTGTVDWNTNVGQIRSDFYGVNIHSFLSENGIQIDTNNDGTVETDSNATWHRQKFLEAKLGTVRRNMNLPYYYNVSNVDGTFNYSHNFNVETNLISWASTNNIKVIYIAGTMPEFLANKTTGYCKPSTSGLNTSCSPKNYTLYTDMIKDFLVKSGCAGNGSTCEVEVWNEPNLVDSWLNNISTRTNVTISIEFNKLVNATLQIKNTYPNIKVGASAIDFSSTGADNLMDGLTSNFTNQVDWFSFHRYTLGTTLDSVLQSVYDGLILDIIASGGSSDYPVRITEFNFHNGTITNSSNQAYWNLYSKTFANTYTYFLNKNNVTVIPYHWTDQFQNGTYYPENPHFYNFIYEPAMGERYYPPFNITKLFATNHKALNYVVTSSVADSTVKIVASKDSNGQKYITLTNTNTSAFNVTLKTNVAMRDVETNKIYPVNSSGDIYIPNMASYGVQTLTSVNNTVISLSSTSLGVVRSDFYGVHATTNALSEINWIDALGNNTLGTLGNTTWNRETFQSSGMKFIRKDMGLNHISTAINTFKNVNYTTDQNIESMRSLVKWTYENNITLLLIANGMPNWLADANGSYCTINYTCPPTDYTQWGDLVINFLNNLTLNGTYSNHIQIEVWNEPDHKSFWLNNGTNADRLGFYNKLYNYTYYAIKSVYPNMPVTMGGFSCISGCTGDSIGHLMMPNFFGNETNIINKLNFHYYEGNPLNTYNDLLSSINIIINNASLYNVNYSSIIIGEFGSSNSTLQNTSTQSDLYKITISESYRAFLNYPSNLSLGYFMWADDNKFANGSYKPKRYEMVSEPQSDNTFYPPYNITKQFTRYAPAQGTIYNTTITDEGNVIKVVSSKISNKQNLIITNTENGQRNITLSCGSFTGNLIDVSSGELYSCASGSVNLGVTDEYEVRYLTEPVITYDGTYATYSNYLGEFLTKLPSIYAEPEERQLVMCSTLSGTITSFANMVVWFILAGAIFVIFHVIKNNGNINPDKLNIPDVPEGFKIPVGLIIFGIIFVAVLVLLITTVVCSI